MTEREKSRGKMPEWGRDHGCGEAQARDAGLLANGWSVLVGNSCQWVHLLRHLTLVPEHPARPIEQILLIKRMEPLSGDGTFQPSCQESGTTHRKVNSP